MFRLFRRLLVVAVVLLGAALLARFVVPGSVDAGSLARSVSIASGSAGPLLDFDGKCTREPARDTWTCGVLDGEGSGNAVYRVVVRDGSCWRGRITLDNSEGGGMARRLDGCVHLWQWSLVDLL